MRRRISSGRRRKSSLVKAAEHIAGFRGEATVRTWLRRIATNEHRMLRRLLMATSLDGLLERRPGDSAPLLAAAGHADPEALAERRTLGSAVRGSRVLAVVAHPDDESFGLGAVIVAFSRLGSDTALLCFTHGEASSLRGIGGDLRVVRQSELNRAAATLGVGEVRLLDYPDGKLNVTSFDTLRRDVEGMIERSRPDMLLVFDEGGITGHPDHTRATEAAIAAARGNLPVVAWALPQDVAAVLNLEFGTAFYGRPPAELDIRLPVDRATQRQAIACHASQATDNPVLWRRLELLGDTEWLRILDCHGS